MQTGCIYSTNYEGDIYTDLTEFLKDYISEEGYVSTCFLNETILEEIKESNRLIVFKVADKIVGVCSFGGAEALDMEGTCIGDLYVLKEYRNRGIGKTLVEKAEKEALNQMLNPPFVLSILDLHLQEFYKKLGYKPIFDGYTMMKEHM